MSKSRYSHYSHRRNNKFTPWIVFIAVFAILLSVMWFGWQIINGRPILSQIPTFSSVSGKTVTIGLRTAPKSLDIRTDDSDELQQALLENVYETLVNRDENNALKPGLAESWDISKNGLVYKFNLRHGVNFSNGVAMDSKAVLQSIKQGIVNRYPGYEALDNIKSIDNTDKYSITIELNSPDPLLLRRLAGRAGIVYDTGAFINYSNSAIGTGPFTVDSYKNGDSLVMRCNDRYWGTRPKLGGITLKYFKDDASLTEAMSNGSIQMALPLEGKDNKRLASVKNVTLSKGKSTQIKFIAFNSSNNLSVSSEDWIRRGFCYSVDPKWAIDSDGNGGVPVGGPIDQLSPGYEDLTKILPFDKAQARRHFSYFSPRYFKTVVFLAPKENADLARKIADSISSTSYAKIDLQILDSKEVDKRIKERKYDLALTSINHTLDIDAFVNPNSPYAFQNSDSQKSYFDAMNSPNAAGYEANIKKYAKYLKNNAAAAWIYARNSVVAVKSNIEGYPKNMTDQLMPLRDLNVK